MLNFVVNSLEVPASEVREIAVPLGGRVSSFFGPSIRLRPTSVNEFLIFHAKDVQRRRSGKEVPFEGHNDYVSLISREIRDFRYRFDYTLFFLQPKNRFNMVCSYKLPIIIIVAP